MTFEAKVRASLRPDFAVRIVASRAVETRRSTDLVRVGNSFLLAHVGVAAVTNVRRDRAHLVRIGANRRVIVGSDGRHRRWRRGGLPVRRRQRFVLDRWQSCQLNLVVVAIVGLREICRLSARRHRVVPGVAIGARYAGIGVRTCSPRFTRLATVILVALQAGFASLRRSHSLEAAYEAGLLTARAHMLTARTMARLARLLMMDVRLMMLDIRLVAGGTELVVVHHFRFGHFRDRGTDLGKFSFPPARSLLDSVGR